MGGNFFPEKVNPSFSGLGSHSQYPSEIRSEMYQNIIIFAFDMLM